MGFLGIDIGCSAIKYGLVHLDEEAQIGSFDSIAISLSAGAEKYAKALEYVLQNTAAYSAVGVGFPSRIWANKILRTTIDFDGIWSWLEETLRARHIPCAALNDADAAGLAEISRRGAAELRQGVTILLTLGSGIGSAVFLDGRLLPNTELGALQIYGARAEYYAAASVLSQEALTLEEWAGRLQVYLDEVEYILSPHHLILGGGISANFEQYKALLHTRALLRPAYYTNQAGVLGAALYAASQTRYYNEGDNP